MYLIKIDDDGEIERIGKQLGSMHDKAPNVLATAINATSRRSSTLMKQAIRKMYTYQRNDKVKKAFANPTKASKTNLSSTVSISSEVQHLSDFKVTPNAPSRADYGAVKAQLFKSGGAIELVSSKEGNPKAFIARFSNGKVAVVQRVPREPYGASGLQARFAKYGKNSDPTRIKALFGPSIPKMAAKVHEESVRDEVSDILQENIQKQIAKVIAKQMAGK